MSTQRPQPAESAGDADDFADVPDARITIDFQRDGDEWVAYGPGERDGITGRAPTRPLAVVEYGREVAEHLEAKSDE